MFEKFTPEARRVVVLAQEDARALNHNLISPEHLLISLTRDEGIAGQALESLGATSDRVQAKVAALLGRGPVAPAGNIPFTPVARTVLERAVELAFKLRHTEVRPEHILLSLTRVENGIAPDMLKYLGTSEDSIQEITATLMVKAETTATREAEPAGPTGPFTFRVQVDRYGTVHGGSAASNSRKAEFTLHPGEFFSVSFDGTVDETVRCLDYAVVSKVADENYADVVILTSHQKDVDALDGNGSLIKVGVATVWTPEPIAHRLVFLG